MCGICGIFNFGTQAPADRATLNRATDAMAVNVPIVAVNVGDVVNSMGTTEGCYLVPREADAMAAKIVEVCRKGTRTSGREWIRQWSMEKVAKQVLEVYASVASAGE
jgi:glycosyltransferase involved in cell wall biosynthesis